MTLVCRFVDRKATWGRLSGFSCGPNFGECDERRLMSHQHEKVTCELYCLANSTRGRRLGELLSRELAARASEMGYERLVLDTLDRLPKAIRLYESLGFVRRDPYNDNPQPDVIFMECELPLRPETRSREGVREEAEERGGSGGAVAGEGAAVPAT